MKIVVCGGGVIGACIARFLARRGAAVEVVERTGIACAASGKAGGFLARDWCDGTPLEALARRSFDLHAELAAEPGADWGWRRVASYAGTSGGHGGGAGGRLPWLAEGVTIAQRLSTGETTAQVHPARFTEAMLADAVAHGARLRIGEVTGLVRRPDGGAGGVTVGDGRVAADAVVLAMGPWSRRACGWVALPAVFGLKGHSVVLGTGDAVPAEALFLEHRGEHRGADGADSPEVFPRPDGTTYVCAVSSEAPLPDDPAEVAVDPGAEDRLAAICAALSPMLAAAPVLARQACYRPATRDGLPLIGAVPGTPGAFVATGHGVWGILNAPATGEAMAGLILDGRAALDLAAFDPGRLPPARA